MSAVDQTAFIVFTVWIEGRWSIFCGGLGGTRGSVYFWRGLGGMGLIFGGGNRWGGADYSTGGLTPPPPYSESVVCFRFVLL
jgi:hypothetical protein